ncbi:MAG: hypothetical protein U5R14_13540 [Gemmatimonadota bacterium]|nr:hypothetical protein [Gemmatimonadota bacterium]
MSDGPSRPTYRPWMTGRSSLESMTRATSSEPVRVTTSRTFSPGGTAAISVGV